MAKGNGKNGNGHNGNGANGVKNGRGVASPKEDEPTWAVTEPEASAPAIVVPPRSLTPLVVGAAALALGGGVVYAVHRWRQQQRTALDTPPAEPGGTPEVSKPASQAPAAEAPSSEARMDHIPPHLAMLASDLSEVEVARQREQFVMMALATFAVSARGSKLHCPRVILRRS